MPGVIEIRMGKGMVGNVMTLPAHNLHPHPTSLFPDEQLGGNLLLQRDHYFCARCHDPIGHVTLPSLG